VPNQLMLDDQEIAALKAFVAAGGSLVITGRSGYCDKNGNIRTDGSLSELTGIHLVGETAEDVVYLRPMAGSQELFAPFDAEYPVSIQAPGLLVRADPDVEVLACLTLPYSHSQEIDKFGSAISNPPGQDTDYPAVTLRRYGQGRVLYLAAPIEESVYEAQRNVFCNLVNRLVGRQPLFVTDAPAWLEVLVYRDDLTRSFLVYACKTMEEYHKVAAEKVTFSLTLPEKTVILQKMPAGEIIPCHENNGMITWTEAEIHDFVMYRLNYAR
jgi:hypothetical protein